MPLIAVDSNRDRIVRHATTAVLSLAGVAAMMIFAGARWRFDLDAPEFNPLNLLLPLLGAVAAYHAVQTVRCGLRLARQGVGIVEIAGNAALWPGAELRGRVRLARPLAPGVPVRLTLRCLDIYEFEQAPRENSAGSRRHAQLAWQGVCEIETPADRALLPFAIRLPAALKPMRGVIEPERHERPRHSSMWMLRLPFIGKVVEVDERTRPVDRRWQLLVQAPPERGGHHAEFELPIRVGT